MRCAAAALLLILGGCASTPPPAAPLVAESQLAASVVPGQSSTASVRAALGAGHVQVFDSGFQVWDYRIARGAERHAEFVILFGPDGMVRKTRLREPPSAGVIP